MTGRLTYQLYIDGAWVEGTGSGVVTAYNPSTEQQVGSVPQASLSDVNRAVEAARRAFDEGPWPRMSPTERSEILIRFADEMERRYEELVSICMAETGSTRMLADFLQVGTPLEHFRDMAERVLPRFDFDEPMLPYDKPGMGVGQGIITKEAIGVAALITPFNFPLFLNVCKIGPALAAGCTTVLKPSPYTPLEAFVLGEIADAVGLPPGVLNVVTGDIDASEFLTRHPMVDMVSFTGSDVVGRKVYTQAADSLKKVVLELGGKSANLIMPDADLEAVAPQVVRNMTAHAGQGCSLLTRTIVHRSIHDELIAKVVDILGSVKVGDHANPDVMMGPLISDAQRTRVEKLIQQGQEEGGKVAFGGGRPAGLDTGFFVEPTLFVNVNNSMTIAREEIFGPVGVVIPFDTEDEAISIANDSNYGLGGSVWSANTNNALSIARRLRTGYVDLNGGGPYLSPQGPFGGYKSSGLGREWGSHGLAEFLESKTIHWMVR
ncbi:aldehyde dehydrogenase family protein [Rhodococcus koreensis]|uniref:aldehyde dehydrogenase family protein n=1 Tax=Rhodococcus koreensis TaxID=99653 RepID=UPI00366A9497